MSSARDLFEAWWTEHGQFVRSGGGDYVKSFAYSAWQASRRAQHSTAEPERVYIVATGELYEGQETYTRHANRPPPLCDAELLFAAPQQAPLTDEQIDDLHGEANRGFFIEREDYFKAFRDAERAHGISAGKETR